MAQIGEIKSADEIGKSGTNRYIYTACPQCGKKRWVSYSYFNHVDKSRRGRCAICAGREFSLAFRTDGCNERKDKYGYITVRLFSDDFFYPMCYFRKGRRGMVKEHRLIMAQHLHRCLLPWEVVHHKNGIKDDNRLENLELLSDKRWHLVDTRVKAYIKFLERKIQEFETALNQERG